MIFSISLFSPISVSNSSSFQTALEVVVVTAADVLVIAKDMFVLGAVSGVVGLVVFNAVCVSAEDVFASAKDTGAVIAAAIVVVMFVVAVVLVTVVAVVVVVCRFA